MRVVACLWYELGYAGLWDVSVWQFGEEQGDVSGGWRCCQGVFGDVKKVRQT